MEGEFLVRGIISRISNSEALDVDAWSSLQTFTPLLRGEIDLLRPHQCSDAAALMAIFDLVPPFLLLGQDC